MSTSISMTKYKTYQAVFYNENNGGKKSIGSFGTYDEALEKCNKFEIEFYKENSHLLPKGVVVNANQFVLSIRCYLKTIKGINKPIASARTLSEIRELKLKCLNSVIG